jgi:hypothetical protein
MLERLGSLLGLVLQSPSPIDSAALQFDIAIDHPRRRYQFVTKLVRQVAASCDMGRDRQSGLKLILGTRCAASISKTHQLELAPAQ